MEKEPFAAVGNVVHVYDFRVKPGTGNQFIAEWDAVDKSGTNPMHHSPAQVKDGVLCRDENDPDHCYLLGEWSDRAAHYAIWEKRFGSGVLPKHLRHLERDEFRPTYAYVVA